MEDLKSVHFHHPRKRRCGTVIFFLMFDTVNKQAARILLEYILVKY